MKFRKAAVFLLLPALLLSGCAQELPDEGGAPLPGDLAALSSQKEEPSAALPETFSLPYDSGAALDPVTCPDGAQQTLGALLYEGLFQLDEELEPQYRLCTDASCDPEAMTWTLRIREGVTFSDGSSLTASDVAATLNRARTAPRYQARLACVQSVRAAKGTVVITLNRPNTGFTALLDIPIVKAGTENNSVPTGTGPYTLVSDSGNFYLAPNSSWWGSGKLPADRIELVPCTGSDALRYQFTSHAVQLITADLTDSEPLSAAGSFSSTDADTSVLQYIGFNVQRELLSDPAVRRALSLGVDRSTVADVYLSGHAVAAQFPVSPVSALYPAELETGYSYNAFEDAMTDVGLNTGETTRELTLLVNDDNSFKVSIARYLASSLSVFDLKFTVETLPWEDYLTALAAGNYDLYFAEVRLTADWDLTALIGTGGQLNYSGWSDPAMDEILSACAASQNRAASMRALCARLFSQAPILPVCFKRTSVLTQTGVVEGLSPTAADPFYNLEGITLHLA